MSGKMKAIQLLDKVPEYKIDYIVAYIEGVIAGSTENSDKKKKIDWESYGMETDRGKHVEEYMEEIRNDDRAEKRRSFLQSKRSVIPSGRTAYEIDKELKELRNDRF